MGSAGTTDYSELLKGEFSVCDMPALKKQVFSCRESRQLFRDFVSNIEDKKSLTDVEKAALAACYCIEGRYERALELSGGRRAGDMAQYVSCRCKLSLGRPADAAEGLADLAKKLPAGNVHAALCEALRKSGDIKGARAAVKAGLAKFPESAALLTEAGILADVSGDYDEAIEYYMKAYECDNCCVEALFRLAFIADLRGDNETALEYYQRCIQTKPVRSHALVNLGLLYEEMGRQADAVRCFRLVVSRHPTDLRVKLHLKDALASEDMFFDEELQKRRERRNKVLETPITDFELSVRSRNCLEKMNVTTLGDLTRISEPELLSFKNFGETSLTEIKQMLATKLLRLGQATEEEGKPAAKPKPVRKKTIDHAKIRVRSVDDLGLSVRSQHCMQLLGVKTIGDLVAKAEKELMQAKNFGNTSLLEIKKKLAAFGLALTKEE